jgi:serine/threonine-protein kinase
MAFCKQCNAPLSGGAFCGSCGARQVPQEAVADPLIGAILGDRYEVIELLNSGGMGRVYRGVQRALDRSVAIKIIDPRLVSRVDSQEVTARFLTEARAASQLNHPHVVSIFDFGHASEGQLFIAMELLQGPTLGKVIRTDGPLPIARVARILRQVLAALGEAHYLGITHRDVKPDNIILERPRGSVDHVKVIDFGIAKAGTRALTRAGRAIGTPYYMSPEQAKGLPGTPSMDLYSAGVILFELLTGRVPFDDSSAGKVLDMHISARRPDPREVAPGRKIPAELARVCLKALEIDPEARFPDAESFAKAIAAAASSGWTPGDHSLFPPAPFPKEAPSGQQRKVSPYAVTVTMPQAPAGTPLPRPARWPFVGREADMASAESILRRPRGTSLMAFTGKDGIGRTRALEELAGVARGAGALVVEAPVMPPPLNEIGFSTFDGLIGALGGRAHADRGAALRSALRDAALRANGAVVLVLLDDLDHADRMSLRVLGELLDNPEESVLFAASWQRRPEPFSRDRVMEHELLGISRDQAMRLVGRRDSASGTSDRRIEPLYLEQYLQWRLEEPKESAPRGLAEIARRRLDALSPANRRALQAVAVVGASTLEELGRLTERPQGLEAAVDELVKAGLLRRHDATIRLAHALFGRFVLDTMPTGALARIHLRAAAALEGSEQATELRAYHAIRGNPDFEAFMLVEQAATLRNQRGDADGEVAALNDGFDRSRRQVIRGDFDAAASAWQVFGRKLAFGLSRSGKLDQAHGILLELLDGTAPGDKSSVAILSQLATLEDQRGRPEEAKKRRDEVARAAIAEQTPASSRQSRRRLKGLEAQPIPRNTEPPPPRKRSKS